MDGVGAFYFDFVAPEAYAAAERVLQAALPAAAEWVPVRSAALPAPRDRAGDLLRLEAVAAERGLQPVRRPPAFDPEVALRAATYARSVGRAVPFALAAFRQAYAGGADLGDPDVVLIAASACEMHPRAVLQAVQREGVVRALDEATAAAVARGVRDVPAVWLPDGRVLHGDGALG